MRRVLFTILLCTFVGFGLGIWFGRRISVPRQTAERPVEIAASVAPTASAPAARPGEARLVIKQHARLSGSGRPAAVGSTPAPAAPMAQEVVAEPTPAPSAPTAQVVAPEPETPEQALPPAPVPSPSVPAGEAQTWEGPLEGQMEVEVKSASGRTLDTVVLPLRGEFQATLDEAGHLFVEGAFSAEEAAITLRRLPSIPPRFALTLELTTEGLGGEARYNILRTEHLAFGTFVRYQGGEIVGGVGLTLAF